MNIIQLTSDTDTAQMGKCIHRIKHSLVSSMPGGGPQIGTLLPYK